MVLEQIANLSTGLIRFRGSSPRRSAKFLLSVVATLEQH